MFATTPSQSAQPLGAASPQQEEIIFHLFPEHWPQKQFQQFATNQSLFAVQHDWCQVAIVLVRTTDHSGQ